MPHLAPTTLTLIDRALFLASVATKHATLMRMRTESPGLHLLGVFSDDAEMYALIKDIGPRGEYPDIRTAAGKAPPGLHLAFLVPCVECPPYAIPKDANRGNLPDTLRDLNPPPKDIAEQVAASEPVSSAPIRETVPPTPKVAAPIEPTPKPIEKTAPQPTPVNTEMAPAPPTTGIAESLGHKSSELAGHIAALDDTLKKLSELRAGNAARDS